MTMHTPGPWQAEAPKYSAHVAAAIWRDGVRLAQVDHRPKANESEEMANAYLIAAAPELLAIARRVADLYAYTDSPLGIDAMAAIRKATEG